MPKRTHYLGEWLLWYSGWIGQVMVPHMTVNVEQKESDILDDVQSLKVGKTSYTSDHRPITLTIGLACLAKFIKLDTLRSYEHAPLGFQWKSSNPNSAVEFKKAQSNDSITSKLCDLSNRTIENGNVVKTMNDDLISLYESICELYLTRKKTFAG